MLALLNRFTPRSNAVRRKASFSSDVPASAELYALRTVRRTMRQSLRRRAQRSGAKAAQAAGHARRPSPRHRARSLHPARCCGTCRRPMQPPPTLDMRERAPAQARADAVSSAPPARLRLNRRGAGAGAGAGANAPGEAHAAEALHRDRAQGTQRALRERHVVRTAGAALAAYRRVFWLRPAAGTRLSARVTPRGHAHMCRQQLPTPGVEKSALNKRFQSHAPEC